MESRSKDKEGFGLTRRIPAQVRSGVSPDTLAKLDVRESGLMVFRNFNNQDAQDRKLFASIWSAIISRDRTNQIACFTALMNAGVWQLLRTVLENRPDNAYAPDFVDIELLYRFVRTRRPRRILEFGSGLSSLVLASALSRNGSGHLHSIDPLEKWADETRDMLPEELRPFCTISHSPSASHEVAGTRTARFGTVPDMAPDFIYLDGAPEGAAFHGAEEIHLLEERLAPGTVVLIDGRFKALQFFLDGNMKRRWRVVTQTLAVDYGQEKLSVPPALDLFSNSMCLLEE